MEASFIAVNELIRSDDLVELLPDNCIHHPEHRPGKHSHGMHRYQIFTFSVKVGTSGISAFLSSPPIARPMIVPSLIRFTVSPTAMKAASQ